ncbi:hypothetical protein TUBRATIS_12860 [Tubulinosema ratisbonensis]|uniref:Uncharacterized protein n=1 Tax=Tubulinosema ratisbonensis TaxID=291195 RepID=A0A437AMB3_9MICR|nr:hypothetical protein TUBRATIS_12860 [Tubulinosema ratisbonensis]
MIILKFYVLKCSSFINIPQNWQGEIQINYCGNPPMVLREGMAYPLPICSNPQKNTTVLCVEDPSLASKTPFPISLTYNPKNFTSLPLVNFVHTDRCYRKNNTKACTIDSINSIPHPKMYRLFYQVNLPILNLQPFFQRLGQIIQTHMLKYSNGVMLFDPKEILTIAVTEFEGNQILIIGYLLYYNFFLHGFINFKLSNANKVFMINPILLVSKI